MQMDASIIIQHYDEIIKCIDNDDYEKVFELLYQYSFNADYFNKGLIFIDLSIYCLKYDDTKLLTKLFGCNDFKLKCYIEIKNIMDNNYLEKFLNVLDNVEGHGYNFPYFRCNIYDDVNVLKLLLEHKYQISNGYICDAIYNGYTNIIIYLIDNGYDIQKAVDGGIHKTNLTMLKLLYQYGISFSKHLLFTYVNFINRENIECIKLLMEIEPYNIDDLLYESCGMNGEFEPIKYFISIGADIHTIKKCDIFLMKMYIIKYLFSCGYHVDEYLVTDILQRRFYNIEIDDVKYLLEYGADINCVFDVAYFSHVIKDGCINHIKFLVENYYDLIEPKLNDIFVMACVWGVDEIVKYFCELGLKMDNILMIMGCYYGRYRVVKTLLKYGFDCNEIDGNLYAILSDGDRGIRKPYCDIIKDNLFFPNNKFSFEKKHFNIFNLLIKYKIPIYDFEKIFIDGPCAFYDVNIVKYCIDSGMDIREHILLKSCVFWGKIDLIKLLLENSVDVDLDSMRCKLVNDNTDMKNLFGEYGYVF